MPVTYSQCIEYCIPGNHPTQQFLGNDHILFSFSDDPVPFSLKEVKYLVIDEALLLGPRKARERAKVANKVKVASKLQSSSVSWLIKNSPTHRIFGLVIT